MRRPIGAASAVFVILLAPPASAQTGTQAWADLTLQWIRSHKVTLGLDIEPKVLVSKPADQPPWATLDVTPSVEYTPRNWLDLTGQLLLARTRQDDEHSASETTPRIGLRFHLFSTIRRDLHKEKQPKQRLVLRNFVRLEWRNLNYSDDKPSSSTLRLRDRIELEFPFNRTRTTDDGVIYALSDAEWFWTHTDPSERFANKQRVRVGIGTRRSFAWRTEIIAVWDRSRDAAADGFASADLALDVRVKHVW